jgi:hypothetical protein
MTRLDVFVASLRLSPTGERQGTTMVDQRNEKRFVQCPFLPGVRAGASLQERASCGAQPGSGSSRR